MCIDSDRFGHQRYYETYQDLLVHMQDLFHVARSRFPLSVPGMNGKINHPLGMNSSSYSYIKEKETFSCFHAIAQRPFRPLCFLCFVCFGFYFS